MSRPAGDVGEAGLPPARRCRHWPAQTQTWPAAAASWGDTKLSRSLAERAWRRASLLSSPPCSSAAWRRSSPAEVKATNLRSRHSGWSQRQCSLRKCPSSSSYAR